MNVDVLPYCESWPTSFLREQSSLAEKLGLSPAKIHHIGSTSVPGLAAKPIIDILVEVESLAVVEEKSEILFSLGYEAKGEYGITGRRYFRKGGVTRTHHLHAYEEGSEHVFRHLAFRDYLRCHSSECKAYETLKLALAKEGDLSKTAYSARKAPFIEAIQAKAIRWSKRRLERDDS